MAYDTVRFDCPHCQRQTTEQVGQGAFMFYALERAPERIVERLIDPTRQVHCEHCNQRVVFNQKVIVQTVVEKWVDEEAEVAEAEEQNMRKVLTAMGVSTSMTLDEALRVPGLKFMIDPT